MASLWAIGDPRWRIMERGLLVLFVALFAHSICAWRGLLGVEPGWKPLQSVFLTGAMVLQGIAPLVQRRSRSLWLALLITSLIALAFSVLAL